MQSSEKDCECTSHSVIEHIVHIDGVTGSLPVAEQKAYKEKNWEQVFDITPFENDWTRRGDWVQATVWELRKDMIRDARFFRTGKYKKT